MKLKSGFSLHEVCGEKVLIAEGIENINFSKMVNLNASAAYIWEEIASKEFTAEMLANLLCEEYEVEYNQALNDIDQLILQWKELGLIEE